MKKTYRGSCHCGTVRFECELDLAAGTMRCNCSFCKKARFWMALAKATEFRLLQGKEALVDYRHTPPKMQAPFLYFDFCGRCGVRAFTRGGELKKGEGAFYAVNLGCLDDASDEELALAPIHFVDGRHDDWKANSTTTTYI